MKVLIIDDSPIDIMLLESWVGESPGNEPYCFTSAGEAISWCRDNLPDFIVVDYHMPVMNGIEFLSQVRAISGFTDIPVVMVTAEHDKSVRYDALNHGANDFLNKPLDKMEFIVRMNNMLNLRRAHIRLEDKVEALEKALSDIKRLQGLLPICASCKKIRDDQGYWKQIEAYLSEHSDLSFSHGICPDCLKKLYPEIYERMQQKKKP